MKNFIFTLLGVVVVAGVYFGMNLVFEEKEVEGGFHGPPDMPVAVEAATVERRPLRETVTYPGSVTASETISITSKVTGAIEKIYVELGDFVSVGDPLIEIDDSEFVERLKQSEANLKLSQAQLRRATTSYNLASREYERTVKSGREGISSQRELDAATANQESGKAEMDVAKAEVDRVRAALEEVQLNVENTRIASPVAGWVQARLSDPGTLASPSSPILTLVDTDPAEVVVYLPEREIELASIGREATVSIAGGTYRVEGTVSRTAPSLRIATRTSEVVIDVPNPDTRLKPGMSADVTLVARFDDNALVVPESAVTFQNDRTEVYRILDGKAFAVPIETGIEQDGLIQILSGLEEGDRVVTKGQFMIRDGSDVDDGTGPKRKPPHGPGGD